MKTRALLLQSASAAAAVAVGANHAAAADIEGYAGPDYSGYTLSLEGGALFANSVDIDKLGSGGPIVSGGPGLDLNLDNDIGYYAGIRLGRRINQNWDVTLGAAVSRFLKNGTDDSYFFSGGSGVSGTVAGSLKSDLDYTTLDFEVGYRPDSLADHDVRLFLGLRGLNSKDSLDKTGFFSFSGGVVGSGGSFSFANNADSEFLGIGPRAGASFAHRFDDSSLGLSGMVAGAAIFGRREFDKTGDFTISGFSGGGPSGGGIVIGTADSENDTVYNLEGALGLDFYLGESSKLTVGARAQKWWNIRGADLGSGGSDDDQLNVGPFMLLEANF